MPALFETSDIQSWELRCAHDLADLLAAQSMFQELAEVDNESDARAKVTIGVADSLTPDREFDADELAKIGFQCRIHRIDGSHVVAAGITADPDETGSLRVIFRRFVRDSEDAQDVFLFFWDRTSELLCAICRAVGTTTTLRIGSILDTAGPYRGDYESDAAQGAYVWCAWTVTWGDAVKD